MRNDIGRRERNEEADNDDKAGRTLWSCQAERENLVHTQWEELGVCPNVEVSGAARLYRAASV